MELVRSSDLGEYEKGDFDAWFSWQVSCFIEMSFRRGFPFHQKLPSNAKLAKGFGHLCDALELNTYTLRLNSHGRKVYGVRSRFNLMIHEASNISRSTLRLQCPLHLLTFPSQRLLQYIPAHKM